MISYTPIAKPCLVLHCPNYARPGGSRCPAHQQDWDAARNNRPGRALYKDPAYRAMTKPYGQPCALQIEGVCTGGATTWDHIVPITKGGTNQPDNLQPACRACNSSKHNRSTP